MSDDQYYSIGQAAKICNISIQTLRFYDKVGVVIPSHTDKSSSYRYYSNFDLLNIKIVQDEKDSLDSLVEKLESKRKHMISEIQQLERVVESIGQRTNQISYLQELGKELKDLTCTSGIKAVT
jgi:MerR family transcriptional activator of bmr gene